MQKTSQWNHISGTNQIWHKKQLSLFLSFSLSLPHFLYISLRYPYLSEFTIKYKKASLILSLLNALDLNKCLKQIKYPSALHTGEPGEPISELHLI